MVFFEWLQNVTMVFTCGLYQAFQLLLIVNKTISAQERGIYGKGLLKA